MEQDQAATNQKEVEAIYSRYQAWAVVLCFAWLPVIAMIVNIFIKMGYCGCCFQKRNYDDQVSDVNYYRNQESPEEIAQMNEAFVPYTQRKRVSQEPDDSIKETKGFNSMASHASSKV